MISPEYFAYRWSWYRPILNQGEDPAERVRVDVRRLPLRVPGPDAGDYVPFAVHSQIQQIITTSLRRLQDYAIRYMIKGEKVSAHKLPVMNAEAREMVKYLRGQYPHLSPSLLHHWCAEEQGAQALLKLWRGLWVQGWKQDHADVAPWVPAINVLLLRLMRESIAALPKEEEAITDHVTLCMVGGLYVWALKSFLQKYVEGEVEVTRIGTYESMMLPATPMAFVHDQPEDALLGDDRQMIRAYGLEPEMIPRMRELRAKVGPKNEGGMLALLARDRLGGHLLRRSWARLSLWELSMKTGDGSWMQWVLNVKKLDQLLSDLNTLDAEHRETLNGHTDMPFASWLLAELKGKRAGEPWLHDERTLNAFRVFEDDVKVEVARRKAERLWLNRAPDLVGRGKGPEADKMLDKAYHDGQIVFLQPDTEQSLHSGTRLVSRQGCLRIEWSDYLAGMGSLHGAGAEAFVGKQFMSGVLAILESRQQLFVDSFSASGCLLRGGVPDLFDVGIRLRQRLREWFREIGQSDKTSMPAVSMCLALVGDWMFVKQEHAKFGSLTLAFALSVAQADAGVARECGVGRLIAYRDHQSGRLPLGGVRVETVDTGVGQSVQMMYNNGFALTASALAELTSGLRNKHTIREIRVDYAQARTALAEFRFPSGQLDLVVIQDNRDRESPPHLLLKIGRPCVGGVDVEVFEALESESKAARAIIDALPQWR
ncbi:MAG TPA: hypothetical protein VNI58_03735 [Mariprofundaceae bacterium]|nr:hypothetical protein [Mariprofundaceae bacterium]